jgi:glycosyltransferase involved in cell wall biosynthesis
LNNLTVIVPFFNEELYLEESVNRLLKIKIYDSIILIDNNSSDQSLEIAKNLAQKNKNIYFYQTDETQGKGVALNFSTWLVEVA